MPNKTKEQHKIKHHNHYSIFNRVNVTIAAPVEVKQEAKAETKQDGCIEFLKSLFSCCKK